MFISQAWAETAAAASQQSSLLTSMLPLLVIFALFYILILRPQSKKITEHQKLLQGLKTGDKVVTAGGIYATVVNVSDNDVTLEIASGVHVKAQKHTVNSLQEMKLPANDKGKK
jgi:preprotein translocase subunit YajC